MKAIKLSRVFTVLCLVCLGIALLSFEIRGQP